MTWLAWLTSIVLMQAAVDPIEEGLALLRDGKTAEAEALFESIGAEHPSYGSARFHLGQLLLTRGDLPGARGHLEIAVDAEPRHPALAWFLLGNVRRQLGDEAGARTAYERAIDIAPGFPPPRVQLAEIAAAEGDLWIALAQLRKASELAQDRPDVFAVLASVARRMGAVPLARCAVKRAGDSASVSYLEALIERDAGDVGAAIGAAERALAAGLDDAAVHVTLGNLYQQDMRLSDAIAAFARAVELDPNAAETLASFALTSLTTLDYRSLRGALERLIEERPDSVNTLYSLGAMYLRENDLEAAADAFERLKRLVPDAPQVYYNLAMIDRRRGRTEQAERSLARFRELKALEDAEWERQNELHRIRLQMQESSDDDTIAKLGARLLSARVATSDDRIAVSGALVRLQRFEDATGVLDAGFETTPYDADLLAARADLARALGDADERRYRERLELLESPCGSRRRVARTAPAVLSTCVRAKNLRGREPSGV